MCDVCRIEVGEVFQLLSLLSDEWGWGRSQVNGASGLIPIVIMEDVVGGVHLSPPLFLPFSLSPSPPSIVTVCKLFLDE